MLRDMREYLALKLVAATAEFASAYNSFFEDEDLTEEKRKQIKERIVKFVVAAKDLGLPLTYKSGNRLAEATVTENAKKLEELFKEVQSRLDDEAETLSLFYIHQDVRKYYNKTDLFGEEFKTSFPSANVEISEAGNCFAFDRFTACAFHLMRSLEVVLTVIADDKLTALLELERATRER
jgi:hypothetical protein